MLALALAALLALAFAPFLFGGVSLMSSDREVPSIYAKGATPDHPPLASRTLDAGAPGWATEPWIALEHRILAGERRPPFWDPYDGYGTPFDAAMQPQPFYPLTALLALHPTPRLYAWWVVARLFLAGFFAALFLRLFAGRLGALAAGVATMFSGYYLLFYNMPHLSVDVTLPMLLWATELVCRRLAPGRVAALGAAAGLAYVGGMPETAALSLIIAGLYGLVRIFATPRRIAAIAGLAAGHGLGLALGAIAILPFIEFVRGSFNMHDPAIVHGITGLISDGWQPRFLLTELVPRAFGGPWESILGNGSGHNGTRGFFGCAAFMLATIAVLASWRRPDARTATISFLAALAAYAVLKRYGFPPIDWTGSLPLMQLVNFPKYIEFALGDAVGILAGFGVAYLGERTARSGLVAVAFTIVLSILTLFFLATRELVPANPLAFQYPLYLGVGLAALIAAGAAAAGTAHFGGPRRLLSSLAVVAVLALEPFFGYMLPTIWHDAPPIAENAYGGAPYLTYLSRNVDGTRERVFGLGGVLFPNWAGAYGLADPTSLNALYPDRFLRFVNAFLATVPATPYDLVDRFTATGTIAIDSERVRRWLALSSVGYLIAPRIIGVVPAPGAILDPLWKRISRALPDSAIPSVHPAVVELDGVAENVLFAHAPRTVDYRTGVPQQRPRLLADIALDPASYSGDVCGSAITFSLSAVAGGRTVARATRTIDPKHRVADRRWIPLSLDLTAFAGKPVDLWFQTSAKDTCAAWSVWGEPRFTSDADQGPLRTSRPIFPAVFTSPGADVYRVGGSLPRLSLFHRARTSASFERALATLTSPSFDVMHEAVVEGPLPALGAQRAGDRVTVTSARSDRVEADVEAGSAALLMQNDTFDSGWRASLDDRPVPIARTDGLFRGIAIPPGRHHVVIVYASPAARAGTILSVAALIVLLLLVCAPLRRSFR